MTAASAVAAYITTKAIQTRSFGRSSISRAPECHPDQAENPGREYPDCGNDCLPLDRLDGLPPFPEMRHVLLELDGIVGVDSELDEGARDGPRNDALNIRFGHGRHPQSF
jgi:hypothetical protein